MSCHEVLFIIIFRPKLEVVFHHRPERNAGLGIAKGDTDHPCQQDVSGLI
jgi:hypothetical protein